MSVTASIDLALMRASALLDSDPQGAAQRAAEILAQAPQSPEAQLLLAAARRKLGDPLAAMGVLERLCEVSPDSPVLQLELGRACAAAGRAAEALAAFRRAVNLDAGLADGWRELAAAHFAAGDVARRGPGVRCVQQTHPESAGAQRRPRRARGQSTGRSGSDRCGGT